MTTYPYVLMATAATGLLIMVEVTSLRLMRRVWHGSPINQAMPHTQ